MSGLYIPDPKNYNAAVLKDAVMKLAETDPTINKRDYRTKAAALNTLISKGVSMQFFPSKSGSKEAKLALKKSTSNLKKTSKQAETAAKKIERKLQQEEKKLARKKAAALKKEARMQLKADKKTAAADERMVKKVQAQLKKQKAAEMRMQQKLNKPEKLIMPSTFEGPLLPTQRRRKARNPREVAPAI